MNAKYPKEEDTDAYASISDSVVYAKEAQIKKKFIGLLSDKRLKDQELLEPSIVSDYNRYYQKFNLREILRILSLQEERVPLRVVIFYILLSVSVIGTFLLIGLICHFSIDILIPGTMGLTFLFIFISVVTGPYTSKIVAMKSYIKKVNKHWKDKGIIFKYYNRSYVIIKITETVKSGNGEKI